jgi:hypothetical protein
MEKEIIKFEVKGKSFIFFPKNSEHKLPLDEESSRPAIVTTSDK